MGAPFGDTKPEYLHVFREINGVHHAPSTPGDLLYHIRAARMDLCFELASRILSDLGNSVSVVDSVQGFRYFDDRDLLGFVDGTENPVAQAAVDATLIGDEDMVFAGGSYVIVQKYLHDLDKWNAIPVEQQEKIIGRENYQTLSSGMLINPVMLIMYSPVLKRMARTSTYCVTICHLAIPAKASSEPILSVTPENLNVLKGCLRICLLVIHRVIMIGSWMLAVR